MIEDSSKKLDSYKIFWIDSLISFQNLCKCCHYNGFSLSSHTFAPLAYTLRAVPFSATKWPDVELSMKQHRGQPLRINIPIPIVVGILAFFTNLERLSKEDSSFILLELNFTHFHLVFTNKIITIQTSIRGSLLHTLNHHLQWIKQNYEAYLIMKSVSLL